MPLFSRLLCRSARASVLVLVASCAIGTAFGQLLYVPNFGSDSVGVYSVTAGGVTLLACQSPNPIATNLSPSLTPGHNPFRVAMAVVSTGSFLYVSDRGGTGSVTAYSVSSTGTSCPGALTPLPASAGCPAANGETCPVYDNPGSPQGIAVDSTGHFLYVANTGTGRVSAYAIGANGALTALSGSPFAVTAAFSLQNLTVSGTTLYATLGAANTNNVAAIPILAGGGLNIGGITFGTVPGDPSWDDLGVSSPADLVAAGGFLYVTDLNADPFITTPPPPFSHGITAFRINANGTLTYFNSFGAGTNPNGIGANASGTILYVANNADNTVQAFSVSGGTLTSGLTQATGNSPIGVAVDPGTGTVYVSNNLDNTVSEYAAGLTSTIGIPVTTGSQPQFLFGHTIPPPPISPTVPASSLTSLAVLALMLVGCAGLLLRRRQPSAL